MRFSYLSTFFSHFTDGTATELGRVMLVSAILGMAYSLVTCSIADRYNAHRYAFILSCTTSYASFVTLLWIAITGPTKSHTRLRVYDAPESLEMVDLNTTMLDDLGDSTQPFADTASSADLHDSGRFYLVSTCIIIGSISQTVNMCLSDAFSTNIAKKCNQSYGSVRSWGAIGWVSTSLVLSFINKYKALPFLAPALILFATISAFDIIIVLLWPYKQPFDMSEKQNSESHENRTVEKGIRFDYKRKFSFADKTVIDMRKDSVWSTTSTDKVKIKVVKSWNGFDKLAEESRRNIRKSSSTPLGNTHIVKLYELDNDGQHFTHVTKIRTDNRRDVGSSIAESDETSIESERDISDKGPKNNAARSLGFMLSFHIVFMIVKRNKSVARSFILFVAHGFAISMNWYYLFPYMESIDEDKFKSLSAKVMISSYASELCFYYVSPYFLKAFKYSTGLSIILLIFALRYALYIPLGLYNDTLPLDLIILVELLQAFNTGWFECIFNEAALEYALKAEDCVPELIEKGYIRDTKKDINTVKNGIKSTMIAVSSCCYDGIGTAIGSVTGGWIIDNFGFFSFWTVTACLTFSFGAINLLFSLKDFLAPEYEEPERRSNKNDR